jgi:mRNA-degrading endonuclease toxin of MazEF toxin-antitoxin module
VICQFGDVVVVLFPFTDMTVAKPRPALVISSEDFNVQTGHTILAMITTGAESKWPTDVPIADLAAAGLKHPSVLRWKLFTLINDQLAARIGSLTHVDRDRLAPVANAVFGF